MTITLTTICDVTVTPHRLAVLFEYYSYGSTDFNFITKSNNSVNEYIIFQPASKLKEPENKIRSCRDRIYLLPSPLTSLKKELLIRSISYITLTTPPFLLKFLSLEGKYSPAKVSSKQDTSLLIQPDSCVHEHVIAYRINHVH